MQVLPHAQLQSHELSCETNRTIHAASPQIAYTNWKSETKRLHTINYDSRITDVLSTTLYTFNNKWTPSNTNKN